QLEAALLRAQRGDLAGDERYLVACLEQDHEDSPAILEALTKGYAQTYRLPEALHCAQQWLKRQPDNTQALFWRGLIWEQLYSRREAAEYFRRVVELDPQEDQARLHLAEKLLDSGQPTEASEHLRQL